MAQVVGSAGGAKEDVGPARPGPEARAEDDLALHGAELALADRWRAVPRRVLRVPLGSLIPAHKGGPTTHEAAAVKAAEGQTANDNAPSRLRRFVSGRLARELVVLLLLAATLGAVYNLGRLNAYQRVISVPDPEIPGTRLT